MDTNSVPNNDAANFLLFNFMLVILVTTLCIISCLSKNLQDKKRKVIVVSGSMIILLIWFFVAINATLDVMNSVKLHDPCGLNEQAFHLMCQKNLIEDHTRWCRMSFKETYAYCQRP